MDRKEISQQFNDPQKSGELLGKLYKRQPTFQSMGGGDAPGPQKLLKHQESGKSRTSQTNYKLPTINSFT